LSGTANERELLDLVSKTIALTQVKRLYLVGRRRATHR